MAVPRKTVKQIKGGTYRPSNIGAKAREAARRLREAVIPTPDVVERRPPFVSVKRRMKAKKRDEWSEIYNFHHQGSDQQVDKSRAYDEMVNALGFNSEQMDEYASRASQAWAKLTSTGTAGELEIYLPYSFLWYH